MIKQLLEFIQNHWLLALAAITILILLIIEEFKGRLAGLQSLSPLEVTLMINRNKVIILDLRNKQAFASGHILGAINLLPDDPDKHLKKIEPNKNLPIILVTDPGSPITTTVNQLRAHNFNQLYLLAGGINAWKEAQLPLSKISQ